MVRLYIFALLFLAALPVSAEEINAGFIQGLWYAKEPVIAGEPNRIYVALRNNSESDLTGNVRFTDNGTRIGVAYVSALPGRIVEAWIDWTPGYGDHSVAASLTNVQIHPVGEPAQSGEIADTVAEKAVFVDLDTDADGIPNMSDADDDNDTVDDESEIKRGTDPLKANPQPTEERQPEPTTEAAPGDETSAPATEEKSGLETYVPEGRAHEALDSLTEKIEETKESLDAYRAKRSDELEKYFSKATTTPQTNGEGATITRSKVEKDGGFVNSVVKGGKALASGLYSLLLSLLSVLLAFPALIELFILLGIIYFIYRTARRFGRRNN